MVPMVSALEKYDCMIKTVVKYIKLKNQWPFVNVIGKMTINCQSALRSSNIAIYHPIKKSYFVSV